MAIEELQPETGNLKHTQLPNIIILLLLFGLLSHISRSAELSSDYIESFWVKDEVIRENC